MAQTADKSKFGAMQSSMGGGPLKKKKKQTEAPKSPRTIKRQQDKIEQQMILDIVKESYRLKVRQNELLASNHESVMLNGSANGALDATVELFRKMKTHCNFLTDLDSLGDMNNAKKLREVIQNEAYILAITAEKNRNLEQELRNVKSQAN